uniref:Protein kinase domain-containing protein n=1 Tax=Dunaliella tertiolecta TaxID=3047 RepID=A0A7S3VTM9_DUNTE
MLQKGLTYESISSSGLAHSSLVQPLQPGWHKRDTRAARRSRLNVGPGQCRAVDPSTFTDFVQHVVPHLPVASEPVALPCSMMKCGDIEHRSTLDLVLRGEKLGPDWRTFTLIGSVLTYLLIPPGVLPGAIDYYLLSKIRNSGSNYGKEDIILGRKLATGGFGTVFLGDLRKEDGTKVPVVVKKAKEFGQAEAWMNERMMRFSQKSVAEFITAFDGGSTGPQKKKKDSPLDDAVWLVWRYEGDNTLSDLIEDKDFPYNLEPLLLDRELRLPRGARRKQAIISLAMQQLFENLQAAHSTGIVHRDVKPQNLIISADDKKLKFIDLGAAADLRVGINYVPNEYLLDPRYAPPQQYVMSIQTPRPPPAPVAAFLSPVLWRMEGPDKFDMYSCGVTLMQMVFPNLRSDNNLINFNKKLATLNWDLRAWRRQEEARKGGMKPEVAEGFEVLDLDNGAGWELLCSLMAYKPSERLSATEALLSPFVGSAPLWSSPMAAASRVRKAASSAVAQSEWLRTIVSSSTGADRGGLTEAFLSEELGTADEKGSIPARASSTIAWWQERQGQQRRKLEKRSGSGEVAAKGVPPRPQPNQPPALKKQGGSNRGWLGLPFWLPGMGPKPVDNNASPAELKRALAAAAAADAKQAKAGKADKNKRGSDGRKDGKPRRDAKEEGKRQPGMWVRVIV